MSAADAKPAQPSADQKPAAPASTARQRSRLLEWLWRGQALTKARAYLHELPRSERERLARAQSAVELADRAYDPVEPLRSGQSLGLAISLYREAAYWALLAQDQAFDGRDLRALFEALPAELLEFAAGGPEGLTDVKQALVERTFVETAALPNESLVRDAKLARDFAHALLERKLAPQKLVGGLLLQRASRAAVTLVGLMLLLLGAVFGIKLARLQPDLAEGKPWQASSKLTDCHPEQYSCGGARTAIFFNTVEEKSPWLRIDLGKPTAFSLVEIENRRDCCPDRAVPLVVEVSNDDTTWREVARRRETFSNWRAEFAQQTARYVRVRALRRTMLHLEKIAVRAS